MGMWRQIDGGWCVACFTGMNPAHIASTWQGAVQENRVGVFKDGHFGLGHMKAISCGMLQAVADQAARGN